MHRPKTIRKPIIDHIESSDSATTYVDSPAAVDRQAHRQSMPALPIRREITSGVVTACRLVHHLLLRSSIMYSLILIYVQHKIKHFFVYNQQKIGMPYGTPINLC